LDRYHSPGILSNENRLLSNEEASWKLNAKGSKAKARPMASHWVYQAPVIVEAMSFVESARAVGKLLSKNLLTQ
jgi:hypothetical protein